MVEPASPPKKSAIAASRSATHRVCGSTVCASSFKKALEQAEVRRVTFHELSHTFGTRMAGYGVALRTIQHRMGPSDSKTAQIYAHYRPSDAEAETVDDAFA